MDLKKTYNSIIRNYCQRKKKPFLILKGETDGNINKKLLTIPIIKNKEILISY